MPALLINTVICGLATAQVESESSGLSLGEVTVTAQRREQSMQEAPVAVSNLSAELLQDSGATDMLDIQMLVPSLSMEQNKGPGFATFRIRGIGNIGNIPNFEPAVGLFIDGAYRSKSGLGVGELVDVDRIEVLRGPQSTLYGRNVTGGLISVITKRPAEDFEGYFEATAADLDELIVKGSISGPISENVQGRLSAMSQNRDGSFDDAFQQADKNDEDMTSVRGQLAFQPNDRLSVLAIVGYVDRNVDCCTPDVEMGATSSLLSTIVTGGQFPLDNDPMNRVIQQNDTYTYDIEATEATLSIDYDFDSFTLTSLTSYDEYEIFSAFDAEQTLLDLAKFYDNQTADTFMQEFRLTSSGDGSVDWMLGVAWYQNDFTRGSLDPDEPLLVFGSHWPLVAAQVPGTPGDTAYFESVNDTENISVFYQGNWHLSDRFALGAGIRWFEEEKTIGITSAASFTTFPSFILAFGVPGPVAARRITNQVAWNINAQYHVSDDSMLYATVSRGAKGGGFNGNWGALTVLQREFEDEEVMSYEVGLKSSLLDRRVTLNANIFLSDFDNFQNATFLGTNFLIDNAKEVSTQGIELDMVALLAKWLTMDLSYTYLDAQYDSFTNGPCVFPMTGNCDFSGEYLPFTADNRWHLGLLGTWTAGSGEIFTRVDYAWTDKTINDSGLDPRSEQSSYGMLNGRIGWRNDAWEFAAWVSNATDEDIVTLASPQTLFGGLDGGRQLFLNDPQSYGATVRVNF
jgi:iron complex outermembrane receptor protein